MANDGSINPVKPKAPDAIRQNTGSKGPSKSPKGAAAVVMFNDGSVLYDDGTLYDAETGTTEGPSAASAT